MMRKIRKRAIYILRHTEIQYFTPPLLVTRHIYFDTFASNPTT